MLGLITQRPLKNQTDNFKIRDQKGVLYFPKPGKRRLILEFIKKWDIEKQQNEVFKHYQTILSRFSQFTSFENIATIQKCAGNVALDKFDLENM